MSSTRSWHPVLRHGPVLLCGALAAGTLVVSWIVNPHSASWLAGIYLPLVLFIAALRGAKDSPLLRSFALYMAFLNQYLLIV